MRGAVQRFSSGSSALHTDAYARTRRFETDLRGRPPFTSDEYREIRALEKHANSSGQAGRAVSLSRRVGERLDSDSRLNDVA